MKKLIGLLMLSVLVCVMITGCGEDQPGTTETTATTSSTTTATQPTTTTTKLTTTTTELTTTTAKPTTTTAKPTTAATQPTTTTTRPVTSDDFIPGARTEQRYINESIGLCFAVNDAMVMATDEEIGSLMQVGTEILFGDTEQGRRILEISNISTVYDMLAINVFDGSNVMIIAEKLPLVGMTTMQYIEAFQTQLSASGFYGWFEEPYERSFCGHTYLNFNYIPEVDGNEPRLTCLFRKMGDRIVGILMTYYTVEEYDAMLMCFSAL